LKTTYVTLKITTLATVSDEQISGYINNDLIEPPDGFSVKVIEGAQTVEQLRAEGYCVVIFNPKELRGVDADLIEAGLEADGLARIDFLAGPGNEKL
jgi:hypothetical protein